MASENETIADIIAEKREMADALESATARDRTAEQQETIDDLRTDADRIEAAWKREREELDKRISDLEAYAKLWTGRADELRLKCDEFYAKAKPVGNAAAMREACAKVRQLLMLRAALAAPARNCEKMPDIENLTMHDLAKSPCKSTLEYASREELLALVRWLLAPAAERKGDGDDANG